MWEVLSPHTGRGKNPQKREKRGREKREKKDGFNGSAESLLPLVNNILVVVNLIHTETIFGHLAALCIRCFLEHLPLKMQVNGLFSKEL